MANIKLIQRRIKSVKNIAQITRAMEMVAASKMKKAQERAIAGKPYADRIFQAVKELATHTMAAHPLFSAGNPRGKTLVVLISTSKGLCGGLNTNLFRMIHSQWGKDPSLDFVTLGKKGQSYVVHSHWNLTADFSASFPFTRNIPAVTAMIVEGFTDGTYKEAYLVYNTFLSALKQEPTKKMILPLSRFDAPDEQASDMSEFLIEPNADDVLSHLLPHYLENQIRSAVFEAEASEHSARMIAMKNANDAALDFVSGLTLVYNKARQEKITNEIADLVTARMAVS